MKCDSAQHKWPGDGIGQPGIILKNYVERIDKVNLIHPKNLLAVATTTAYIYINLALSHISAL